MQKYYTPTCKLDLHIQSMIWSKGKFLSFDDLKEKEKEKLLELCKNDPRFKTIDSPSLINLRLSTIIKVACATVRSELAANDAYINHTNEV
jgi:hypothetical protein